VVTGLSRAERLSMPLARSAIRDLTLAAGGCIRLVQMRRTNTTTGETDYQCAGGSASRADLFPERPDLVVVQGLDRDGSSESADDGERYPPRDW
jgi:hypothetical protein